MEFLFLSSKSIEDPGVNHLLAINKNMVLGNAAV